MQFILAVPRTGRLTVISAMLVFVGLCLLHPELAFSQAPPPGPGDLAPAPDGPNTTSINLALVIVGVVARGLMYVVNKKAPFLKTEPAKQAAVAIVGAVAGALYQIIFDGHFGFNDGTLNAVLQALIFTLAAHNLLYKPGFINEKLGGGQNADGTVSDPNLRTVATTARAR